MPEQQQNDISDIKTARLDKHGSVAGYAMETWLLHPFHAEVFPGEPWVSVRCLANGGDRELRFSKEQLQEMLRMLKE